MRALLYEQRHQAKFNRHDATRQREIIANPITANPAKGAGVEQVSRWNANQPTNPSIPRPRWSPRRLAGLPMERSEVGWRWTTSNPAARAILPSPSTPRPLFLPFSRTAPTRARHKSCERKKSRVSPYVTFVLARSPRPRSEPRASASGPRKAGYPIAINTNRRRNQCRRRRCHREPLAPFFTFFAICHLRVVPSRAGPRSGLPFGDGPPAIPQPARSCICPWPLFFLMSPWVSSSPAVPRTPNTRRGTVVPARTNAMAGGYFGQTCRPPR